MASYMNNIEMDSENEFTSSEQENKNIVHPPAFKRTALATLHCNSRYGPLRELKAKMPLSNIAPPVDIKVQPISKPSFTFAPKNPAFEIFQDEQCEKENTTRFRPQQGSSACQRSQPSTTAIIPQASSTNVDDDEDDKESVYEECKENFAVEDEEPDTSTISLPENVVRLFKYEEYRPEDQENKENHDSPMVLDDTLNGSQDLAKQAWLARKNLYNFEEYAEDVYKCLRETEVKHRPKSTYMRKQPDITQEMRGILVDWLVEVSEEYKLHTETLYLAVSLVDRFLSVMSVLRNKLQLVGTASMFIAAKYEEIYPPEIKEFVYITDDTYSKKQVIRMEHLILKVLSFDLNVPTAYFFLHFVSCVTDLPRTVQFLAQYLCELTLLEADPFLRFLPSEIAAAAICLSNYTMGYQAWDAELEKTTGYTLRNLNDVIDCLYVAFRNSTHNPRQAVRQKYKATAYHSVSTIAPPEELLFF